MSYTIIDIQAKLKQLDYYHNAVNGLVTIDYVNAVIDFQKSTNLNPDGIIGPLTIAALFDNRVITHNTNIDFNSPIWLRVAKSYIGVEEITGHNDNPIIMGWWKRLGISVDNRDLPPWCAGFVGGVLEECGIRSSRSALARSYEHWGATLPGPALGAVASLWRGSRVSGLGHVVFVVGISKSGKLLGLGGNQGNSVNIKPIDTSRVLAYCYPASYPRPLMYNSNNLPIIDINGNVNDSEI
jgi:uncharacterized protein (TIGR02594 family)